MADKMPVQDLAIALARMEQGWQELSRLLREQAQAGNGTITAEKFELVDGDGRPRGSLGVKADGSCGLVLTDQMGRLRAWLGIKDSGAAYLSLKDEAGRIIFEAGGGGPAPREVSPPESGGTEAAGAARGREEAAPGLVEPRPGAVDLSPEPPTVDLSERPGPGEPGPSPAADLSNRLGRLERQNRRMKLWGGALLVLWLAALAGLGSLAHRARPRPGPVATEALAIKSQAGNLQAWLGTRAGVPSLEFYDREGKVRTVLGLGQDGAPRLTLFDGQQRPRAELALGPGEEAGLSLVDQAGLLRAALGIIDPKYQVPPYLQERPVSSLVLFNQEGTPVWHAPLKFRR